ncbi:DUF2207 family protein [Microbacterium pygmaeum]|uniref:Predicted membrane protein n=1 Tax=Microbacterium pygmaeum TaxID=370764 RepID=A0A1G7WNA8_9MICO|nr:DUF2207 domain-containing protein [Microbacterium pygmaeum]SDG73475.1 Predicted membrane protein [Microbacterium pygmaeum]
MGTVLRVFVGAVLALVLSLLAACSASVSLETDADSSDFVSTDLDDFSFQSLDVQYTLGREDDGSSTLLVVERFVALFPDYDQNRGMRRSIPESTVGPHSPRLISITDGDGNPRPSETESEDGVFSMTSRADDYVHGEQTYVFTYLLENVTVRTDAGVDEFYWNVPGTDSPQPFGPVTARTIIPPELAGRMTGGLGCYVGSAGSTQTCSIAEDDGADTTGAVVQASTDSLSPYQTMTFAIGFDEGTFTPFDPSYLASPWGWLQAVGGLGLLGSIVYAVVVRRRRLSDGRGRPTIIAEYTPPRQVDALESAVLLGRTTKAIPAEVLEQAVVGSIRIVEGEKKLFGGVKLKAQLIDPTLADGDGKLLLGGLFPALEPGTEYEFGQTDTRFSSAAQNILALAAKELVTRGLRREVPFTDRVAPVLASLVAAAVVFVCGVFAVTASVEPLIPILLMVAAGLTVFIVSLVVSRVPLTAEGAEVRDHLAGLKVFIEWAEADRIRMLQSPSGAERVRIDPADPAEMLKLYEVLLPYAVVFGQEKQWAEHLAVLYGSDNSPGWYAGSSAFSAASFSSGISSLSATSSSSSSSGGSSGGGSAGGGGGGGGTGGV